MGRKSARNRKSGVKPKIQGVTSTRSSRNAHLQTFHRDCKVLLHVDDDEVGTARLMPPCEEEKSEVFRRVMHGSDLRRYAKRSEDLVAIVQAVINEGARNRRYPYSYGGVEGPPNTLGEMEGGIHSWDVHALSVVRGTAEGQRHNRDEGNSNEIMSESKGPDKPDRMSGTIERRTERIGISSKEHQGSESNHVPTNGGSALNAAQVGIHHPDTLAASSGIVSDVRKGSVTDNVNPSVNCRRSQRVRCRKALALKGLTGEPSCGSGLVSKSNTGASCGRTNAVTVSGSCGEEKEVQVSHEGSKRADVEERKHCAEKDTAPLVGEKKSISPEGGSAREKDTSEVQAQNAEEGSERESVDDSTNSTGSEQNHSESEDEYCPPTRKRKYNFITRVPRDPAEETSITKKRKIFMESLTVDKIKNMTCCNKLKCFQTTDQHFLRAQACRVLKMSQHQRRDVLQGMLDTRQQMFTFNGQRVCCLFLEQAFGFSRYLQATVKGPPASKRARDSVEGTGRVTDSQREAVICYLERLAESTADRMPDREEYHIPFFKKDDVYNDFALEYRLLYPEQRGENNDTRSVPCRSYFYQVWSKHCSSIKVRKNHRFAKCGDCERIRDALEKSRGDPKVTNALKEKKRVHNETIMKERREYAKKIQKAILYPQEYCSIIVDGADQSAFGLPHFRVAVKESKGHSIGVKLIGVLEHGHMKKVSLFLMTEQYETGANHIIEAIHRHLSHKRLCAPLPRTLYIQVDNCHRENKNQFFFGYVESLVAWGVFCEVYVSYLPIGHTHADIDQVFSRTSTRLRHHDAITMEDLMNELSKSYTPEPRVVHMKGLINFSGLCKESKCISAPTGFTSSRYFHFGRSQEQSSSDAYYETTCSMKAGCEDEWVPLHSTGGNGFLIKPPNLTNTPATPVTEPRNLHEVNRRLASEECRIQTSGIMSLRQLRDEVYQTGNEDFHWNLSDCIETNGRYKKCIEASDGDTESDELENERPRADLEYERNDHVAITVDKRDDCVPFWLARVEDVERNSDGVIVNLLIHWYELTRGKSAYKGTYKQSTVGKGKNSKPFLTKVHVNTVFYRFSKLTTKMELSVNDRKGIWQALH